MAVLLYVDDSVDELLLFEAACRMGHVRFTVRTAEGSEEGLRYLAGSGPYADRARYPAADALLLDLKMGGSDGFAVLARVRSDPQLAGLPVLLFTGSSQPEDVRRSYALGADACLYKPVELARTIELAHAIEACFAEPGTWRRKLAAFEVK